MLRLNFFASIREATGRNTSAIQMPSSVATVADLIDYLAKDENLSVLRDETRVLVAVDQCVVGREFPLFGSEEVAFFPPMTGG